MDEQTPLITRDPFPWELVQDMRELVLEQGVEVFGPQAVAWLQKGSLPDPRTLSDEELLLQAFLINEAKEAMAKGQQLITAMVVPEVVVADVTGGADSASKKPMHSIKAQVFLVAHHGAFCCDYLPQDVVDAECALCQKYWVQSWLIKDSFEVSQSPKFKPLAVRDISVCELGKHLGEPIFGCMAKTGDLGVDELKPTYQKHPVMVAFLNLAMFQDYVNELVRTEDISNLSLPEIHDDLVDNAECRRDWSLNDLFVCQYVDELLHPERRPSPVW